ncbi:PKMYT1 [Cordylochernes scorpioides]|uniref:non-specific serine/threonine protein kinase n=1 Tax=Cordylochernes scorpioides TaxID=51811 RepID=A0ABY6L7J5_9ARAC|nr:PKMYT1 [Cordylochernes scorpioides]
MRTRSGLFYEMANADQKPLEAPTVEEGVTIYIYDIYITMATAELSLTKCGRCGRPPRARSPPGRPSRAAPPISRLFPHKHQQLMKPRAVSFVNSQATLQSPHYNENSPEPYFDQVFQIVCKLGAGSFGDVRMYWFDVKLLKNIHHLECGASERYAQVFKVKSKDDQQFYAVKKSRERYKGALDRQRKLEEVRRHEELPSHANCVQFIRAWEECQHLYIQTELCEMSLNQFAENNHDIPETLVWKYLLDLIQAVKHLHDHEVLHLDIKPANIFVTDQRVCKLGDFGLAATSTQLSDPTEGDPKYLAPELMEGVFTKAADIFSLGITILELATDLDLPLGGPRWHELRQGVIPEVFVQKLSAELVDLIRDMMHPEPSKRPTADQVLTKTSLHINLLVKDA